MCQLSLMFAVICIHINCKNLINFSLLFTKTEYFHMVVGFIYLYCQHRWHDSRAFEGQNGNDWCVWICGWGEDSHRRGESPCCLIFEQILQLKSFTLVVVNDFYWLLVGTVWIRLHAPDLHAILLCQFLDLRINLEWFCELNCFIEWFVTKWRWKKLR